MRFVTILLLATLFNSCSSQEPIYHSQHYVFGTLVDISIYGESDADAQQAANAVIARYTQLHQRLHAWQDSEITAINQAFSNQKAITVKPDIAQMLMHMKQLSEQSDGLFNPAIGKLIQTWGFHQDQFVAHPVDKKTIKRLVAANPQMSDLTITEHTVSSQNTAVQLDLGGYAKGYALDLGLQLLKKRGIEHALINIGGNIIALGMHGDQPWKVGIQHPRQPNAIATVSLPSGWAIGTSGDYQRYFELDGQRYCHLINPRTGYPAQGIQSVTIMVPAQTHAGTLSDALSKPLFMTDKAQRTDYARSMQIHHFLVIEDSHHIQLSKMMASRIHWIVKPDQNNIEVLKVD